MKKFKVKCEDKNYIVNAKSEAEAVKKLRDAKAKKLDDAYYTESEKKDKTFVRNAIEEMSRYIRNWNYLSAKEKRDIGSNLPELKARVEELRRVADGKCIEDAEPIIVEAIPYRNEMYVVLEFSWNGSKRWIVVAKENYHNEKKYTGGGSVEYSLNEAKKTADDFYTMNKLDKKYGRTEGYKRWMRGETDSFAEDKKFCPSMKDETEEEKERKAQEWVDYDIKHYGKVSEQTKEDIKKMGLDFDKWDNQVEDSVIKDYRQVDVPHIASYGWLIERDLARDCYWEAVEELAGTLKTEQDYVREIPKLAKQKFENYIKQVKAEFEKLISAGRSQTSNYNNWAPEQARAIMKKQENK